MRSLRLRRRAVRTVAVVVVAVGAIGMATLTATSDEPSKPGPVAREGATVAEPVAPPDETPTPPASDEAVPSSTIAPASAPCPNGWSYFDNPRAHYGLCTPPGWGFSDFSAAAPLDRIPAAELENLHLLGNAFPWRPGAMPFDAVRAGAFDVELDVVPSDAGANGECAPSSTSLAGALTFLSCEQLYDDDGLPATIGSLRAIKVLVPLRDAADGDKLLVIARARTGALPQEVTTLWQIIRSIRVY